MTAFIELLDHLSHLLSLWQPDSSGGAADLRQTIHFLARAGEPRTVPPAVPQVVEKWLDSCCQQPCIPQHQACIQALREIGPKLHWFAPAANYAGSEMAQNYAFVRLVGPPLFGQESPFYSDKIAAGFSVQAPNVFYPSHWHPAVEFYGVLTGTARWQLYGGPFEERPPGSFIHHPSNAPHAMHTGDQPMLTVFSWIGDIETRPVAEGH